MINSLNSFGKIVRQYSGKGKIKLNIEYDVDFEVAQTTNGNIYLLLISYRPLIKVRPGDEIKLDGKISDDYKIKCEGKIINVVWVDSGGKSKIIAYANYCTVGKLPQKEKELSVIFGLTNLEIMGTYPYEYSQNDRKCSALQYYFNLEGFDILVRRISNYDKVINHIKYTRSIDISCIAIVQNVSTENLNEVEGIINNLCFLLTLAKGCKVSWLYYDVFLEDNCIYSYFRNNITKPFGKLKLISTVPGKDLEYFVKKTFSRFIEMKELYELEKVINEYNDAKNEEDYLEFRGLKLTTTIEHLKSCFLRNKNREYIIDEKLFETKKGLVKPKIKKVLSGVFADEDEESINLMVKHYSGFNNFPFRKALSEICETFHVSINSNERDLFVKIRNNLVHTVQFLLDYKTPCLQYCFLITFIGQILLSMLDYDGYFLDWTKINEEKRTKLIFRNY